MGYVLPWGQISFWAATVITKFVRAIPKIGNLILQWVWGGYRVGIYTLKFFFRLHFLIPIILIIIIFIHLRALHFIGSRNKIILFTKRNKIKFHHYYIVKDLINFLILIFVFILLKNLWITNEIENFIKANYIIAPAHIRPEWYFLFTYAILRSIPNKIGGVIIIGLAIIRLIIIRILNKKFSSKNTIFFVCFLIRFFILRWIGGNEANDLITYIGLLFSIIYFSSFRIYILKTYLTNKLI